MLSIIECKFTICRREERRESASSHSVNTHSNPSQLSTLHSDAENKIKEEEEKKREQNKKLQFERDMRLAQIKEKEAIRERERELTLQQELAENARAKYLIQMEKENKDKVRDEKKLAQERTKRENDRLREMKAESKRKQSEEDMKMIRESMYVI